MNLNFLSQHAAFWALSFLQLSPYSTGYAFGFGRFANLGDKVRSLGQNVFNGETSLTRAEKSFVAGSAPPRGGRWVANPGFETTRSLVGKSFAGTEEVPGEPVGESLLQEYKLSQDTKADVVPYLISFLIHENMAKKAVTFAKQVTEGLASVVMVTEYHPKRGHGPWTKLADKLRELFLVTYFLLRGATPEFFSSDEHSETAENLMNKMQTTMSKSQKWHKELGPQHSHWYLCAVATDPEQQGKGYGSEIMRRVVELADENQMDCYLEAGSEKNKCFYEKFGFELVERKVLEDKQSSDPDYKPCELFLMTREHSK